MPKEEVKMFNAYAQWLYTGKIPSELTFEEGAYLSLVKA